MFDEFKNAFSRHNNAHVQLIIINVTVFLIMAVVMVVSNITESPAVFSWLHAQVAIPAPLTEFIQKPRTIITYSFVHDLTGIWHILFNMLVFYWFGKIFIEYPGSDKVIALYVLGALTGAFFTCLFIIQFRSIRLVFLCSAWWAHRLLFMLFWLEQLLYFRITPSF